MEDDRRTAPKRGRARRVRYASAAAFALVLLGYGVLATRIVSVASNDAARRSDAIIVLGAATRNGRASPAFQKRIEHAIDLRRRGFARVLVFTGGVGRGEPRAESVVARDIALGASVPAEDVAIETTSHTTRGNLLGARARLRERRLRTAILVSDPLHLHRAAIIARDLGMDVTTSPARDSVYRTLRTRLPFLLRELVFHTLYAITGR